jgi:hypothetical protein
MDALEHALAGLPAHARSAAMGGNAMALYALPA